MPFLLVILLCATNILIFGTLLQGDSAIPTLMLRINEF